MQADIVIYKNASDIAKNNNPFIIVECKSDNVYIDIGHVKEIIDIQKKR